MRIFILLLLSISSTFAQQYYDGENVRPRLTGDACVVVIHNLTSYAGVCSMQGGAWLYDVPANSVREYYLGSAWSGYVICNGAVTGMRDNLGPDVDSSKPFIRHIYIYRDYQAPASIGYHYLPAVQLYDPYDEFTRGCLFGVTLSVSIIGLRLIRRAFFISTT